MKLVLDRCLRPGLASLAFVLGATTASAQQGTLPLYSALFRRLPDREFLGGSGSMYVSGNNFVTLDFTNREFAQLRAPGPLELGRVRRSGASILGSFTFEEDAVMYMRIVHQSPSAVPIGSIDYIGRISGTIGQSNDGDVTIDWTPLGSTVVGEYEWTLAPTTMRFATGSASITGTIASTSTVPEPTTVALTSGGLVVLAFVGAGRRRTA